MRKPTLIGLATLLLAAAAYAQSDSHNSLVIIFNDGHQQSVSTAGARIEFKGSDMVVSRAGRSQTFSTTEIARIEFNPETAASFGRGRFVGRWRAGDGAGSHFFITLDRDGQAHKTQGEVHGTWSFVDGEARIAWDDGWHDVIRKVAGKYQKVAYSPGKSFSDTPSNIDSAENTDPQPL